MLYLGASVEKGKGFALNLKPKMEYYDSMIPCGIQEYGITSISDRLSLGKEIRQAKDLKKKNDILCKYSL